MIVRKYEKYLKIILGIKNTKANLSFKVQIPYQPDSFDFLISFISRNVREEFQL